MDLRLELQKYDGFLNMWDIFQCVIKKNLYLVKLDTTGMLMGKMCGVERYKKTNRLTVHLSDVDKLVISEPVCILFSRIICMRLPRKKRKMKHIEETNLKFDPCSITYPIIREKEIYFSLVHSEIVIDQVHIVPEEYIKYIKKYIKKRMDMA